MLLCKLLSQSKRGRSKMHLMQETHRFHAFFIVEFVNLTKLLNLCFQILIDSLVILVHAFINWKLSIS